MAAAPGFSLRPPQVPGTQARRHAAEKGTKRCTSPARKAGRAGESCRSATEGFGVWQPISEDALLSLIATAEAAMDPPVMAFWERIRVRPVKWALPPWGDDGHGFWVVAVAG